jgi:hypothetical protein
MSLAGGREPGAADHAARKRACTSSGTASDNAGLSPLRTTALRTAAIGMLGVYGGVTPAPQTTLVPVRPELPFQSGVDGVAGDLSKSRQGRSTARTRPPAAGPVPGGGSGVLGRRRNGSGEARGGTRGSTSGGLACGAAGDVRPRQPRDRWGECENTHAVITPRLTFSSVHAVPAASTVAAPGASRQLARPRTSEASASSWMSSGACHCAVPGECRSRFAAPICTKPIRFDSSRTAAERWVGRAFGRL